MAAKAAFLLGITAPPHGRTLCAPKENGRLRGRFPFPLLQSDA
jgi:hypothetical protein